MLCLSRRLTQNGWRSLTRSYIESGIAVANAPPSETTTSPATEALVKREKQLPVSPNHGLYTFFRQKAGEDLVGEDKYEVFETPDSAQLSTGRAWKAEELRNKSFKDLHILWYVCLREKNLLATQKEEVRRMGVSNPDIQVSMEKVRQCRKTMARIKLVLNERRLAYQGALKRVEEERKEITSGQISQLQTYIRTTEGILDSPSKSEIAMEEEGTTSSASMDTSLQTIHT